MFKTVKTIFVSTNAVVLFSMIAIAMPAVTGKAETGAIAETLISEMVVENISFGKRADKDFFLIHPEKFPEEYCMAQNVYFEASIDNKAGMASVADVTLNRVRDSRYPNTVCGVVKDAVMKESWKTKQNSELPDEERIYYPVRNKCQFSWWCDGKSDDVPLGSENWVRAQMVAWEIMHEDKLKGITEGATHYHATYVNPSWNRMKNLNLVGRIGLHIFYRWD